MSKRVWKTVEARTGKVGMEKIEGGRSKRRSRKKTGGKGKEEEAEEKKDSGSKENSREVGNLE